MQHGQIAVVGGGIAGLIAAASLAKRGLTPVLFEAAPDLGGRAQTRRVDGFCFNQGPHALYAGGAFNAALAGLGIAAQGRSPRLGAGLALWNDEAHSLPVRATAAQPSPPLSASETRCLAETFARIAAGDSGARGESLRAFTAQLPRAVGKVIEAFVRLTNYAHAPEDADAKAALDQLALSYRGAIYVDGGWGALVAQLAESATARGATLQREHRVTAVRRDGPAWRVELAGQAAARFDAVILAVPPSAARDLAPDSADVAAAAHATQPVRAMCLDVGLSPAGHGTEFALGIDAPTYLSLHSTAADLAPPGAGLLHLSRYLAPGEAPSASQLEELERLADRLRPGWRDRVAHRQRLVGITIAHDYPRWRAEGRRAPVVVSDAPGLFLAGDWVGDEGMLSDAAAASGAVAAREAAARLAGAPA